MKGMVFDIQRFSIYDGPGIRTTVFLKGCPLKCKWCHNPESQRKGKEIAFYEEKCAFCGACVKVCPVGAQIIEGDKRIYDRSKCLRCGLCARACLFEALRETGKEMAVDEVLEVVEKDRDYYETSGGGITVSGGEPMLQFEFFFELLKQSKAAGIHTCIETSGFAPKERFAAILPYVDLFLYDFKAGDEADYRSLTGVSDELVLENLDFLCNSGAHVELRCPLVPGVNDTDTHMKAIAEIEKKYPSLDGITIMPYHNTGNHKYIRYGHDNPLPDIPTAGEEVKKQWMERLKAFGAKRVKLS